MFCKIFFKILFEIFSNINILINLLYFLLRLEKARIKDLYRRSRMKSKKR